MRSISDDSTPVTADTFAAGLSDRFLRCRELGHVWRPHSADYDQRAGTYDRVLRCSSCRTTRHQVLDRTGGVLSNSYRYPDHYLAGQLERGTYTRDVFRLEAVVRFIDHATNQKAV